MKLALVKDWINHNLSPFAWQRVLMRKFPEIRDAGYFFHTLTDDTELPTDIRNLLSDATKELYQTPLPQEFLT